MNEKNETASVIHGLKVLRRIRLCRWIIPIFLSILLPVVITNGVLDAINTWTTFSAFLEYLIYVLMYTPLICWFYLTVVKCPRCKKYFHSTYPTEKNQFRMFTDSSKSLINGDCANCGVSVHDIGSIEKRLNNAKYPKNRITTASTGHSTRGSRGQSAR